MRVRRAESRDLQGRRKSATGIASVVFTFLLVEVLYNKRYDNALKLVERITKEKLRTEK